MTLPTRGRHSLPIARSAAAARQTSPPVCRAAGPQHCVIPNWLPPAVLNTSRQRHWASVRKEVNTVKETVWASAKHAGWQRLDCKARLTVVFVHPVKRTRDEDNTVARAKHVIDGLKPFFVEDSPEWLERHVRAEVRPGVKQTELTLEPIA